MCAGLVGTATSNGLLELRKKLDPSYTSQVGAGFNWVSMAAFNWLSLGAGAWQRGLFASQAAAVASSEAVHPTTLVPAHPCPVQNEAPSIVGNASCWAMHMGLSSNFRYQALNGLDMVRRGGDGKRGVAGKGLQARQPGAALRLAVPDRTCPSDLSRPARPLHWFACLQVLQPIVPSGVFRLLTSVIRGANNMVSVLQSMRGCWPP